MRDMSKFATSIKGGATGGMSPALKDRVKDQGIKTLSINEPFYIIAAFPKGIASYKCVRLRARGVQAYTVNENVQGQLKVKALVTMQTATFVYQFLNG